MAAEKTLDPVQARDETAFTRCADDWTRRGLLSGAAALGLGLLAGCRSSSSGGSGATGSSQLPFGRKLKAAFSNCGLGSTWCASGKETAERWGKWFGVDVTWFDGGLNIDVQRKAVEDMATGTWDFVAIQTLGIDTLVDPVSRIIAKKTPVVQMDTLLSKNDIGAISFLEPDNEYMGEVVGEALFQAIGGQGNVIQTQGALGHTGAQRRAAGFRKAMSRYPNVKLIADDTADWDINKVATLWEDYLVQHKKIDAGYFHNDDMALAAARVIRNAGREKEIKLGGVDAMPEAIKAVRDGVLLTSVRNPACRIHWGGLVVGALAATGMTDIPKYILMDGPAVTRENAAGLLFMQEQFLV
jgi:ribose transport system substrate-binding protein